MPAASPNPPAPFAPPDVRAPLLAALARRMRPDGMALALPDAAEPAVDATVWAALVRRLVEPPGRSRPGPTAERRLAADAVARLQAADGRVSVALLHPGAYSPTAIAILAWHGCPELAAARMRAVDFLLTHAGDHFQRSPTSPLAMDTSLAGWPWIDRTFSWAEPTALALLALESAGAGDHPRAREGRALLLDRQIASGGWNYGNANVFGSELRPTPESTGLVLAALAGRIAPAAVAASLAYLERVAPTLRTPLALGWACLARAAWRSAPIDVATAIRETLARESRYGAYETADLALLACAAMAPHGLLAALAEGGT